MDDCFAPHIGRDDLRCHLLKADIAAITLEVAIAPKAEVDDHDCNAPFARESFVSEGACLEAQFTNALKYALEIRRWREAHGSTMPHKGEPSY